VALPQQQDRTTASERGKAVRRRVLAFTERTLGECFAPSLRVALPVLLLVVALLGVIAYTLSIVNALVVIAAVVVMRISCERRGRAVKS
jgi:hypothetical protein